MAEQHSAGTGHTSKDSKPHERSVSTRDAIRLVGHKPNRARPSKREERATSGGLEREELQLLLSKLALRERTLVLLDAATGLRVSELLALRWEDVDFKALELRVIRSIWHQVVGDCKTEDSAKPVPSRQLYGRGSVALATDESVYDAG